MNNWRTTLAAIITALTGVSLSMHWISLEVATAIGTIAVAFGFANSKDHNTKDGNIK